MNTAQIDKLGKIMADMAELKKQADLIKKEIKLSGDKVVEGQLFKATVVESTRMVMDTKKLKALMGEDLCKIQKPSHSVSVKITSR